MVLSLRGTYSCNRSFFRFTNVDQDTIITAIIYISHTFWLYSYNKTAMLLTVIGSFVGQQLSFDLSLPDTSDEFQINIKSSYEKMNTNNFLQKPPIAIPYKDENEQ